MATIRVGVSGWDYPGWAGRFYPHGLPARRRLSYAASVVDTVEVNSTFYGLPSPSSVRGWRDQLPAHAVLAVKGSRFITHNKRLVGVEQALANYFAAGVLLLGEHLGPVLWQLSARQSFDVDVLERFLHLLPHDTRAAAALARRHDERVREPGIPDAANHRLRHVLEPRHRSFFCEDAVGLLRRHGIALAFSHSSRWPYVEEVTAGFVYLRLHGPGRLYDSPYTDQGLRRWADRARTWRAGAEPEDAVRVTTRSAPPRRGRDVYIYFDNDGHAYAPAQAVALRSLLDLPPRAGPPTPTSGRDTRS